MRSRCNRILRTACYLAYTFVYAGWWFHRCREPVILGYSVKYLLFLLVMAVPFFLPQIAARLRRRWGEKPFRRAVAVGVGGVLGVYLLSAAFYYATRQHRFDPFVQMPPPRFDRTALETDSNVYRILALGGSTTRCGGLPEDKRYVHRLETILRRRYPSSSIEVFNAAMEWYTTRHSLINYTTYYHAYRPDVIVVMHGINDLCRSFSPADFAVGDYDSLYGHFYGPAIQGANPPTFAGYLLRRFCHKPVDAWYSGLRFRQVDYPIDRYVSLVPFERNLRRLIGCARHDGVKTVLVTQPSLYKDGMSPSERAVLGFGRIFCNTPKRFACRESPTPESLARAMAAGNAVTRQLAVGEEVWLADAEQAVDKSLANFLDDVHATQEGAQRVAEVVAETLIQAGWIEPPDHRPTR